MINITILLSEEHRNILKVVDVLLEECEQLEVGKGIDHSFFHDVIYFIKNYADGFHHVKEEDILFKAMLKEEKNMHCNPIPVMLHEHDDARLYVNGLEDSLHKDNNHKLIENARGYCSLLKVHIYKEDNVLYPMAEEVLNDNQKRQVHALYSKVNITAFFDNSINTFIETLIQNQKILK